MHQQLQPQPLGHPALPPCAAMELLPPPSTEHTALTFLKSLIITMGRWKSSQGLSHQLLAARSEPTAPRAPHQPSTRLSTTQHRVHFNFSHDHFSFILCARIIFIYMPPYVFFTCTYIWANTHRVFNFCKTSCEPRGFLLQAASLPARRCRVPSAVHEDKCLFV